jgi:glycine/D-amino acid oxidase-like deaminating enzyme
MRATRWGTPPWRVALDLPSATPPDACDVIVVGGGFTGLSTALHCAQRGLATCLVEQGRVGDGASGRTGGVALEGTAHGPLPGVENCLPTLERVVADAAIDCDLRLPGCWLLRHVAPADATPSPMQWRDGDPVLAVVGEEPGGVVEPGALVAGLARAALRAGAVLCEGTPMAGVDASPLAVRTARGTIRATRVVLALNAWLPALLPLVPPMRSALTLAVATAPLDPAALGLAAGKPFYTLDQPYLWGRLRRDGTLVLGAGLAWGDPPESVGMDAPDAVAALARLEARVRGLHPALASVPLAHRWGGPIAIPGRAAPILGAHPRLPGVLCAGGCMGHGIALGVRMGRLLADAIADRVPLPAWGVPG